MFPLWSDPAMTVPFDATGYEARMHIRRDPRAPIVLDLNTSNGKLSFVTEEDAQGNPISYLKVTISHADATALPSNTALGYDIEIFNGPTGNWYQTIYSGTVKTIPEYSHD
jgi:hypothetical protein